MIAVTVISRSYRRVGREAVKRMKKQTGLEVRVIECADADGFQTKLDLDKLCPKKPVLFFDADVWCLREWKPDELATMSCLMAVHDPAVWNPYAFCHTDTHEHGLQPLRYFNSGVMIWRNDLAEHRKMFKIARASWRQMQLGKKKYADVTDQAHLNFGAMESGIPLQWLPMQYNTYCFSVRHGQSSHYPRDIINLHGAGIPTKRKYSELKIEAHVFGQKIYPMHQEVINFEWQRTHQLR
jgi:lipopolysaccharide biosynthesis glycosyltransferase